MAVQFYVYALIDPRNGKPFYIGKGQGQRVNAHEKEARRGVDSPKCRVIRDIIESGERVEKRILRRFSNEDVAYEYERRLIAKIGLDSLTNLASGGRGAWAVKVDPQRLSDLVIVNAAKKIGATLSRGMVPALRFGGKLHDIPVGVFKRIGEMYLEIIDRRGSRWVSRQWSA